MEVVAIEMGLGMSFATGCLTKEIFGETEELAKDSAKEKVYFSADLKKMFLAEFLDVRIDTLI